MARVFNVMVPSPVNVTVLGTDLTETEPMERRPDPVLQAEFLVEESAGKYLLVIESQTDPDEERRRRWPHYIAHLHDKYGCPVVLAVVCSKRSTARWARAVSASVRPHQACRGRPSPWTASHKPRGECLSAVGGGEGSLPTARDLPGDRSHQVAGKLK